MNLTTHLLRSDLRQGDQQLGHIQCRSPGRASVSSKLHDAARNCCSKRILGEEPIPESRSPITEYPKRGCQSSRSPGSTKGVQVKKERFGDFFRSAPKLPTSALYHLWALTASVFFLTISSPRLHVLHYISRICCGCSTCDPPHIGWLVRLAWLGNRGGGKKNLPIDIFR
jgi:hypothetical protein